MKTLFGILLIALALSGEALQSPSILSPYTRFACADLKKYASFLEKAKKNPVKDPKTGKIVGMVGELNNHPNCNAAAVVSVRDIEKKGTVVPGTTLKAKDYWLQVIEPLYVKHFGHASGVFKEANTRAPQDLQNLYNKYKDLEWILVLTIDGGGVRGIIPAVILDAIEKELKTKRPSGWKINENFHFFGGTSTGGLIALFLNYPDERRSAKQVVALYRNLSGIIFSPRTLTRKIRGTGGLFTSRYSTKDLVQQLKKYVGDVTLQHTLNPVVAISMEANKKQDFVFSTIQAMNNPNKDYFMWQAARATSAAPTYFKGYELKTMDENNKEEVLTLIDGGVGANNPTPLTLMDISNFYKQFGRRMPKVFVVSLSTGVAKTEGAFSAKGAFGGGALSGGNLSRIIDNFGDNATHMNDKLTESFVNNAGGIYIRIAPDLGNKKIGLDDGSQKNLDTLEKIANDALKAPATKDKVKLIVDFILADSSGKNALAEKFHGTPSKAISLGPKSLSSKNIVNR